MLSAEENLLPSPRYTILGLVSYFGMCGDLFLDHWLTPRESGTAHTGISLPNSTPSEQAALRAIQAPLKARVDDFHSKKVEHSDTPYTAGMEGHYPTRGEIWDYMHVTGTIDDLLSGKPGLSDQLFALPYSERAASIPVDEREVFPQLYFGEYPDRIPPILLIHGEEDDVVPLAESLLTFRQLGGQSGGGEVKSGEVKGGGVKGGKVELRTIKGADHGLLVGGVEAPEAVEISRYTTEWMLARVPGGQ